MKKYFFLIPYCILNILWANAQNVGIGTSNPVYRLDVNGSLHSTGNAFLQGSLGVGTTSPSYKLQVNNGPVAWYNTGDLKYWLWGYSAASDYFYLAEDGVNNRITVANGGNVGINTNTPAAKLDVKGNANIQGPLTVINNKGILYNSAGTGQLKYYTRTASFTAILDAFGTSVEGSIGFSEPFTSPPKVMVGDIVSTGGSVGQLFRVQLVIYGCTTTHCNMRLINTSNKPVNYNITWNIIVIGE